MLRKIRQKEREKCQFVTQVRVERMGPATVEDLPRYHSLVERIDEVANCWRSTGCLMGPANVGDGYVLEVQIPLSGEGATLCWGKWTGLARPATAAPMLGEHYPEARPLR